MVIGQEKYTSSIFSLSFDTLFVYLFFASGRRFNLFSNKSKKLACNSAGVHILKIFNFQIYCILVKIIVKYRKVNM